MGDGIGKTEITIPRIAEATGRRWIRLAITENPRAIMRSLLRAKGGHTRGGGGPSHS
jgi:hypothetical protein